MKQRIRTRTKKSYPAPKILLLLTLVAIVTAQKKFDKGFIENYPLSAETSIDADPMSTQTSKRSNPIQIEGTLQAEYRSYVWTSGGQVDFQLYFRELPDSTYKDSLILEFSVPFKRDTDFQNKRILYSKDSENEKFKIKEKDIKLFELDTDFHVSKGDEISENLHFRSFETKIYIEKKVSTFNKRKKAGLLSVNTKSSKITYKTHIQYFDLYYERGTKLYRIKIETA